MADVRTLELVVERVWQRGELDLLPELFDAQYVGHDPVRETPICGRDQLRKGIDACRAALPDLQIELLDLLLAGDRLAVRFAARAARRSDRPPTEERLTITGITIARYGLDSRIMETWTWWDALGLLRQTGANQTAVWCDPRHSRL